MKKKLIVTTLILGLLTFGLTGCQDNNAPADTTSDVQTDSDTSDETNVDVTVQTCGGCEQEKECGTYTEDGTDYIVCDDCYDEFAHGMGLE